MATGDKLQGNKVTMASRDEMAYFTKGDYGKFDGIWYGRTPSGNLANLANHEVTENEDGTITVTPSIKVTGGGVDDWHGYLERGVWREVD